MPESALRFADLEVTSRGTVGEPRRAPHGFFTGGFVVARAACPFLPGDFLFALRGFGVSSRAGRAGGALRGRPRFAMAEARRMARAMALGLRMAFAMAFKRGGLEPCEEATVFRIKRP